MGDGSAPWSQKSRLRLQQQGNAHIAPVALTAHPMLVELIGTVGQFALAGVGHIECMLAVAPPFHTVQHHKMLLIPVQDAGQHVLRNQIFRRDAPTHGFEAQLLGAAAYGQQRHAQLVELAQFAYLVHVGRASVVRHNHGQRGCATVHAIELVNEFHAKGALVAWRGGVLVLQLALVVPIAALAKWYDTPKVNMFLLL